MSLREQQPVQRQRRLCADRAGERGPRAAEGLLAPPAVLDDRVAGEEEAHQLAARRELERAYGREAAQRAIAVAEQNDVLLFLEVTRETFEGDVVVMTAEELEHLPPQLGVPRRHGDAGARQAARGHSRQWDQAAARRVMKPRGRNPRIRPASSATAAAIQT